jgi:hypothetical protein
MTGAIRNRLVRLGLASTTLLVGACAQLGIPFPQTGAAAVTPPSVTFAGATLARAPSTHDLAAYYCPLVVSAPLGSAGFLCQQVLGPPPPASAMLVSFDLRFHVSNPNQIPLPLASALVGATLFPATGGEKLGAVCVSLCADGAAGCTGAPAPDACQASSRDVRSLSDFVDKSVPQLLFSEGVALANGQPPSFALPPFTASSQADITIRYTFGPEQLLAVMRALAAQSAGELRQGRLPTFTLPYTLVGTVWFDAGSIGRIAVGWGPVQGTWTLPVGGIVATAATMVPQALPGGIPPAVPGAPPAAPAGAPPPAP